MVGESKEGDVLGHTTRRTSAQDYRCGYEGSNRTRADSNESACSGFERRAKEHPTSRAVVVNQRSLRDYFNALLALHARPPLLGGD